MSLRMQIYNELVNKHSGIRERYMEVHCKQIGRASCRERV